MYIGGHLLIISDQEDECIWKTLAMENWMPDVGFKNVLAKATEPCVHTNWNGFPQSHNYYIIVIIMIIYYLI